MSYIAIDGDDTGRRLEGLIMSSAGEEVRSLSQRLETAVDDLRRFIERKDGEIVIAAGDSVLARLPESPELGELDELLSDYSFISFSVGFGTTMRDAWIALKYAKTRKPAVVEFNDGDFVVLD